MSRAERKRKISERLDVLVDRLREQEKRDPEPHERPIVEVGIQFLKEAVRDLCRQLKAC